MFVEGLSPLRVGDMALVRRQAARDRAQRPDADGHGGRRGARAVVVVLTAGQTPSMHRPHHRVRGDHDVQAGRRSIQRE